MFGPTISRLSEGVPPLSLSAAPFFDAPEAQTLHFRALAGKIDRVAPDQYRIGGLQLTTPDAGQPILRPAAAEGEKTEKATEGKYWACVNTRETCDRGERGNEGSETHRTTSQSRDLPGVRATRSVPKTEHWRSRFLLFGEKRRCATDEVFSASRDPRADLFIRTAFEKLSARATHVEDSPEQRREGIVVRVETQVTRVARTPIFR